MQRGHTATVTHGEEPVVWQVVHGEQPDSITLLSDGCEGLLGGAGESHGGGGHGGIV